MDEADSLRLEIPHCLWFIYIETGTLANAFGPYLIVFTFLLFSRLFPTFLVILENSPMLPHTGRQIKYKQNMLKPMFILYKCLGSGRHAYRKFSGLVDQYLKRPLVCTPVSLLFSPYSLFQPTRNKGLFTWSAILCC